MKNLESKIVFAIASAITALFVIVDIMSLIQRNGFAVFLNAGITYCLIKVCVMLYKELKSHDNTATA